MQHRTRFFRGSWPRRSKRLLEEGQAQVAENVDLDSGGLRPLLEPEFVENVSLTGHNVGTIYRWRIGGETYWLRFPGHVDVARGPLDDDVWERVYFAGDPRFDEPRYTYTPVAYEGGDDYPVTSFKLGVPAPEQELTLAAESPESGGVDAIHRERPIRVETTADHGLQDGDVVRFDITAEEPGEDSDTNDLAEFLNQTEGFQITATGEREFTLDQTDAQAVEYTAFTGGTWEQFWPEGFKETRFYTHTYVTNLTEQGPPTSNPVSITVGRTQKVTVSIPVLDPAAGQGRVIEKRWLYRTASGQQGAQFQFLAALDIGESTFIDEVRGDELAEVLESTQWDKPPADMRGMEVHPAGFMVGHRANRIYLSEPYRPHAWPEPYTLTTDEEIVAVAVFDVSIAVATEGRPYLFTGSDPRSMQPRRLESNEACASAASMVSFGYAVVYASVNGLVQISNQGAQPLTRGLMTPKEWSAYKPSTIRAFEWNGRYVAFYDGGGFIFDPREPDMGFRELSAEYVGGHRDPLDASLYLLTSTGDIEKWDAGANPLLGRYRSPAFPLPYPLNAGAAQIIAPAYGSGITFRLFADGSLVAEKVVTSSEPFVLPGGYLARDFEWEIETRMAVDEVAFGDTMESLS